MGLLRTLHKTNTLCCFPPDNTAQANSFLDTSMPSQSAYTQSPGTTLTPCISTSTCVCPWSAAFLLLFSGWVARAFTPRDILDMASLSRMGPFTTTPFQPFLTPSSARASPTSAHFIDAPPSTTSTRPSPGPSRAFLTRVLHS
eukprot:GHUV01052893.1.p1 GENE.GHUV01052893.1~~GHUV01052893.1.p1  ORF type:complete len:143 (-),score=1.21 GHUV01052893.1:514-942(-)